MSYLHFTSTEEYRKRIIQMGEDSARVFTSGAPGIDNIMNLKLLSKIEIEENLNWKFGQNSALFTYHPVTLDIVTQRGKIVNAGTGPGQVNGRIQGIPTKRHLFQVG